MPLSIYLVSDGTCRTCEQVVTAVLLQFPHEGVTMIRRPKVRDRAAAEAVIREAASQQGIVFYTLVAPETRDAIHTAAVEKLVPVVDLLGPALVGLYDAFHTQPRAEPGVLYQSNRAHFDRMDAVEYTLHHDDGLREHELGDADVVLVGVSRTAKSTTCFYLAYSGIRAANVPLFPDREPPEVLLKLDPRRVIGLTTNPHRLRSVRESRLDGWGDGVVPEYAERQQIAQELRAASAQMARHGWRCVDTSYKAIEEVAGEVRKLLEASGISFGQRGDAVP